VPAAIVARELGIKLIETVCVSSYTGTNQGDLTVLKNVAAPIVALGGDECAGVVRDPAHRDQAEFRSASLASRPSKARARARPEAISSGVSGPFSSSHSAMAWRPASSFRRWAAVCASHALKVVPSARAASSTARASSGGSDIERFSRCAMLRW